MPVGTTHICTVQAGWLTAQVPPTTTLLGLETFVVNCLSETWSLFLKSDHDCQHSEPVNNFVHSRFSTLGGYYNHLGNFI